MGVNHNRLSKYTRIESVFTLINAKYLFISSMTFQVLIRTNTSKGKACGPVERPRHWNLIFNLINLNLIGT